MNPKYTISKKYIKELKKLKLLNGNISYNIKAVLHETLHFHARYLYVMVDINAANRTNSSDGC